MRRKGNCWNMGLTSFPWVYLFCSVITACIYLYMSKPLLSLFCSGSYAFHSSQNVKKSEWLLHDSRLPKLNICNVKNDCKIFCFIVWWNLLFVKIKIRLEKGRRPPILVDIIKYVTRISLWLCHCYVILSYLVQQLWLFSICCIIVSTKPTPLLSLLLVIYILFWKYPFFCMWTNMICSDIQLQVYSVLNEYWSCITIDRLVKCKSTPTNMVLLFFPSFLGNSN